MLKIILLPTTMNIHDKLPLPQFGQSQEISFSCTAASWRGRVDDPARLPSHVSHTGPIHTEIDRWKDTSIERIHVQVLSPCTKILLY